MRQTTAIMIGLFTLSMVVAGVAAHVGAAPNNGTLPAAEPGAREVEVSDVSETSATYLYGPNLQPLAEQTGSGQQTLNIFGPDNRIVAQSVVDADGGVQRVRHLNADHAGSTRVVLDRAGDSVAAFHYTPFGATVAGGEQAAEVRYRYTGHPANGGLFTYHGPVREYDPGSSSAGNPS